LVTKSQAPAPQGLDGVLHGPGARRDDHRRLGRLAHQHRQHLEAVHLRHAQVEQDGVGGSRAKGGDSPHAILGSHRVEAIPLEQPAEDAPHLRIVVDDQDRRRFSHRPSPVVPGT
jgi:hypothetical protein